MNENQSKLVYLTAKLDLKTKEYDLLCKKMEQLQNANENQNSEKYKELENKFIKNYEQLKEIKLEIEKLCK